LLRFDIDALFQQLFVQNDHQAAFNSGRVSANLEITSGETQRLYFLIATNPAE